MKKSGLFHSVSVLVCLTLALVSCNKPNESDTPLQNPPASSEDGIYTAYLQIEKTSLIAKELLPYFNDEEVQHGFALLNRFLYLVRNYFWDTSRTSFTGVWQADDSLFILNFNYTDGTPCRAEINAGNRTFFLEQNGEKPVSGFYTKDGNTYILTTHIAGLTVVNETRTETSSTLVLTTVSANNQQLLQLTQNLQSRQDTLFSELVLLDGKMKISSVTAPVQACTNDLQALQEKFLSASTPDSSSYSQPWKNYTYRADYNRERAEISNRYTVSCVYFDRIPVVQSYITRQAVWSNTRFFNPQTGINEYFQVWSCGVVFHFYKEDHSLALSLILPEIPELPIFITLPDEFLNR